MVISRVITKLVLEFEFTILESLVMDDWWCQKEEEMNERSTWRWMHCRRCSWWLMLCGDGRRGIAWCPCHLRGTIERIVLWKNTNFVVPVLFCMEKKYRHYILISLFLTLFWKIGISIASRTRPTTDFWRELHSRARRGCMDYLLLLLVDMVLLMYSS